MAQDKQLHKFESNPHNGFILTDDGKLMNFDFMSSARRVNQS